MPRKWEHVVLGSTPRHSLSQEFTQHPSMGVKLLLLVLYLPVFSRQLATQHSWSSTPVSLLRCSSAIYVIVVGFLGKQLTGVCGCVCYCGFLPFVHMLVLPNMLHSCRRIILL